MGKTDTAGKRIFVSRRVQGIGLCYRAYYLVESLGLTGWVRNLYDERVEMEPQSHGKDIDQLSQKLQENTFIYIEYYEVERIPVIEERGFHVRG